MTQPARFGRCNHCHGLFEEIEKIDGSYVSPCGPQGQPASGSKRRSSGKDRKKGLFYPQQITIQACPIYGIVKIEESVGAALRAGRSPARSWKTRLFDNSIVNRG
jgi:hypothetical protein